MKAVNTTCERCQHVQKTVKPWKHVPKCRQCKKPMRRVTDTEGK